MDGERYLNLLSNLEIFWVDIHQIRFIRNSFFPTVLSNFVRRCLEICCIRAWWVTLQMWKSWTLTAPTCLPFFSLLACVFQKTWAGTSRNKHVPLSLILQIKHLFHKGNFYIYIFIFVEKKHAFQFSFKHLSEMLRGRWRKRRREKERIELEQQRGFWTAPESWLCLGLLKWKGKECSLWIAVIGADSLWITTTELQPSIDPAES